VKSDRNLVWVDLSEYAQTDFEEVARILGISHDAVRQRVVRAKAAFRKSWEA